MPQPIRTAQDVERYLEQHLADRQVNRILHSFPSPRFWRERELNVLDLLTAHTAQTKDASAEIYVGLPYCLQTDPSHCGFCLFPTEVYRHGDQIETYLEYLAKEGQLLQDFHRQLFVKSIYIGGGTPNLLKAKQYPKLLGMIRQNVRQVGQIPITLEGLPPLFTREKLEVMKAEGVTRISMGAQQLTPELAALSGRQQQPKHVFQALEWATALDMECNVDLIFGWPQQTLHTLEHDLMLLIEAGVPHITHYELNVGGPTNFALQRRDQLPSAAEVRQMYHFARELLLANGYVQLTPYDFQKINSDPSDFVYEECRQDYDHHEVWGWGYAAISDLPSRVQDSGWTLMNARNLTHYLSQLDQGLLPFECGFEREPMDLKLSLLFRNLQSLRVNRPSYNRRFGSDVLTDFDPVWPVLEARGLLQIDIQSIQLTPEGSYYVPLIQALLMHNRVNQLVERHLRSERPQEPA